MTHAKTSPAEYGSAEVKKLSRSAIEIVGSIPFQVWEKYRAQALKNINESVTVDGFRKGMVPENVLISKVGEMTILEETAELALGKAYPAIIEANKLDPVGRPAVQVTKLAAGNDLEFKITTAVTPEVKLPDYKDLAKKEAAKSSADELIVSDKDIEDAILRVRKAHAPHESHDHSKMTAEEHEKAVMENLPEFDDELAKKIGFDDVGDFKKKAADILAEEKKNAAREKRRVRMADAIADAASIEIPDVMIESELNRMERQFSADVERMGAKMEDYLKHAKKTVDDIRRDWRPSAEKKAKLQLVINAIANAENIKPTAEEVEAEVNRIVEHYKDADRESASIYAETVLTNEKVFDLLERQA